MSSSGQHPLRNADPEQVAILVVEDDEGDFMLLERALVKVGARARIWWARDAEEAWALIEELEGSSTERICVVADVRLGATDGWSLLAAIRRKGKTSRVRCALLTGMADQKTRERAEREGADAFFVKPCNATELLEIAQALQKLASG